MKATMICKWLLIALLCAAMIAVCAGCGTSRSTGDPASGEAQSNNGQDNTPSNEQGGVITHTHEYAWVDEVPATCTVNGVKGHYHCAGCNKDFDADKQEITDLTIAAPGHRYGTDNVCTVCQTALVYTDGLAYTLNDEGTAYRVSKGSVTDGDVVIPYYYNELPVTRIGDYAFAYRDGFTSVTIPSSVTSIGVSAFCGCGGLTSVTIPESVTSIGNDAFSGCSGLTSVTIPESVTSIGNDAFYGCSGLTSITIGNGVTSIGAYAFRDCCDLTSITIGNGVTSIGGNAFRDCGSLASITVKSGNTVYHSAGNCLIETASKTLVLGCKSSGIPTDGSVTSIGEYAFYHCNGLTSITIPASVTSIDADAFYECVGLTSVTIGNGVTSIGDGAFCGCTALTGITIPGSVTSIGDGAFRSCSSLASVTLGNGVTSLANMAFSNCGSLTSITIPASVTSISRYVFDGCSSLTSVTFVNTAGWYRTTTFNAASGPNADVTSPGTNATNLVSTYRNYYWYCR